MGFLIILFSDVCNTYAQQEMVAPFHISWQWNYFLMVAMLPDWCMCVKSRSFQLFGKNNKKREQKKINEQNKQTNKINERNKRTVWVKKSFSERMSEQTNNKQTDEALTNKKKVRYKMKLKVKHKRKLKVQ